MRAVAVLVLAAVGCSASASSLAGVYFVSSTNAPGVTLGTVFQLVASGDSIELDSCVDEQTCTGDFLTLLSAPIDLGDLLAPDGDGFSAAQAQGGFSSMDCEGRSGGDCVLDAFAVKLTPSDDITITFCSERGGAGNCTMQPGDCPAGPSESADMILGTCSAESFNARRD